MYVVKAAKMTFVRKTREYNVDEIDTSTTSEFRANHFDELLGFYHQNLIQDLKVMGYPEDIYPMAQLIEDYDDCFPFGMAAGFFHSQVS
jgi:hypothetical protein